MKKEIENLNETYNCQECVFGDVCSRKECYKAIQDKNLPLEVLKIKEILDRK